MTSTVSARVPNSFLTSPVVRRMFSVVSVPLWFNRVFADSSWRYAAGIRLDAGMPKACVERRPPVVSATLWCKNSRKEHTRIHEGATIGNGLERQLAGSPRASQHDTAMVGHRTDIGAWVR